MNMTPHNLKKHNKQVYKKIRNIKNVNKVAYIQFELKKRGFSQALIANELEITPQAVNRALQGLSKITRVDEWIFNNLGLVV